jgi:ferritin
MSKLPEVLYSAFLDHLKHELHAFYFYWAVSTKLKELTSSYPGFAKYFQSESDEEKGHSQQMIDFLIKRGHTFTFPTIAIDTINSSNPLELLKQSLEKENIVLNSLELLHKLGKKDIDVANFLEDMITEQQTAFANLIRKINEIEMLVSDNQLKMGLYLYDQKLNS